MKKVKRRSYAALLLAVALLAGMGLYVWRFAVQGRDWVNFRANQNVFDSGTLAAGTVLDREGVMLADVAEGLRIWSEDETTRISCLHAVGDAGGNIGTGALTAFADRLTGYSVLTGAGGGSGELKLSIDAALNNTAWNALAGRKGAVLLSDYTTGEVLCMVSSPSYDTVTGFDIGDDYYDGVYLNRCLSASYTPGSVFKLVTAAAAIEHIDALNRRVFHCEGSVTVDGNEIVCTAAHGDQTIEQALANSCNCAFAELSLELGGQRLAQYAEDLGLTRRLSLSGVGTLPGHFEAGAAGSAALAWSGIGQYTDLVCPAGLLRFVGAIANGGVACGPVLLAGERASTERILDTATADTLKAMMSYNVAWSYGGWNFPGLKLCAKSGTAEIGDGTSHAWFTGFLDDPDHPYAFVVVIEHGGGGLANAGPVANALLQEAVKP
ncbi:MAG: penicillin-binding protein [Oscillospiraceae bacterium]|nr:penicillin-binding protein [Oscillospiraceae bacterium]